MITPTWMLIPESHGQPLTFQTSGVRFNSRWLSDTSLLVHVCKDVDARSRRQSKYVLRLNFFFFLNISAFYLVDSSI